MTNGLNSSSAIFLGRPHWCSFSSGPTDDDRAAGVVDALAEQVLAERPCLPLSMSDRLFRRWLPVPLMARPRRPLSISASHASWQHALLVADDDLGAPELEAAS
jgi:hypothetical protein